MKRKVGFIIIGFLVVLLAVTFAYREYNRKNIRMSEVESIARISATALLEEFEKDDSLANAKYLGKPVTVTGIVKEFNKDLDHTTIVLGDTVSMSSVRCSMDSTVAIAKPETLSGKPLTVKGSCTGYNKDDLLGSDVILNRCIVVDD